MKTLLKYVLAFAGVASLSLSSALADDCINKTCPFSGKEVDGSNSVEFVAKFCENRDYMNMDCGDPPK